jgi:hypothetical protein
VYTDLIDVAKDRQTIQRALDMINVYLQERAGRIFKPILDYLADAAGICPASELDAHFRGKLRSSTLLFLYDWLAQKGIIEKLAAPVRLTRKSQIALEEPAFFYDAGPLDWE